MSHVTRTLGEVGVDVWVCDGLCDDMSHGRPHRTEAVQERHILLPVRRRQGVRVQHVCNVREQALIHKLNSKCTFICVLPLQ